MVRHSCRFSYISFGISLCAAAPCNAGHAKRISLEHCTVCCTYKGHILYLYINTRTTKVLFRARVDYPRTESWRIFNNTTARARRSSRAEAYIYNNNNNILYGAAADERFPMRISAVRSGHVTAPASADRPARNPPPQPVVVIVVYYYYSRRVYTMYIIVGRVFVRENLAHGTTKQANFFFSLSLSLSPATLLRPPRPSLRYKSRKRLSYKILYRGGGWGKKKRKKY